MPLGTNTIFWQHKPFYLDSTVASDEAARIVWEGDSLPFAVFGVAYLYRRAETVNLAVPGSTIATMAGAGRVAAFNAQLAAKTIGMIWCGTNTLAGEPDTVAGGNDAADQLFAYADARIVDGWGSGDSRLYLMNAARRGDSPPGYPQVAWAQFNVRLAAEAALHSSGPALDMTTLPGTPGDDRYYDPDLVHINPLGSEWYHAQVTAPFLYSVRF